MPKHQLSLGPMPLQQSGSALPRDAKKVGSTPQVDLWMRAFVRCGYNAQQAAGLLGMTPSDFSKAFSVNWPERNGVMKKCDGLPIEVRREFAVLQAADYELTAPDAEQTRVIKDFARMLKEIA